MTVYSLALFVHLVGVLLLFVLLGIEGVTLRSRADVAGFNRVAGPIAVLAILVPGFYMAAQVGWRPWTAIGLIAIVLIGAVGAFTGIAVTRGRMPVAAGTVSWLMRTGLATAVVFDMTVKPGLAGSLVAVAVCLVLAGAAAAPAVRVTRTS